MRSALFRLVSSRIDDDLIVYLAQARGVPAPREHLAEHAPKGHCHIMECDAEPIARGLCWKHYQRQRRNGTPILEVIPLAPKPYHEIAAELTALTGVKVGKSTVARWCEAT